MSAGFEESVLASGRRVIQAEAESVAALVARLDARFVKAVELLLQLQGRVMTTGVGKSGLLARRVASTLTSTGTSAFFLHPVEALHGDLGMVREGDAALAFSTSGKTDEIMQLIPLLRRIQVPIVSFTGDPASSLASKSDIVLDCSVTSEACPHNLAPTSSVAAASAMGDALAVALLEARGFSQKDFAELHPGGRLGRRLLMQVRELMHQGADVPKVEPNTSMRAALVEMTGKRLGCTLVVNGSGRLEGIFTDGDLRRLSQNREDFLDVPIGDVMHKSPHSIEATALASAALARMEERSITQLVVMESDRPVGVVHLHDLLRAGVV